MKTSAVLTGAASAFPPEELQNNLWDSFFASHFGDRRAARAVFAASGVRRRHAVANPIVDNVSGWSTAQRMARYLEDALPLGKAALGGALDAAGIVAGRIGLLVVASCTGYGTPGLDVQLAQDLAMSDDLQRLLIGHVGCHAALPGLAAARDFVVMSDKPAALLCLELTSLHLQPPTRDLEQVIVHGLFGDAASAVVVEPMRGRPARSTPKAESSPNALELVGLAAVTAPGTSAYMTWDVTDAGFRMGLSRRVPDVVGAHVGPLVNKLLAEHGVEVREVAGWAVHPGGPRVLDVVAERLRLPGDALDDSRTVLAEHGNCSSATVLVVLERMRPGLAPGSFVVTLAFGPGLTLYACLMRTVTSGP